MVYDEEQSNKILAVSLQGVLDILETKGSVSNETHVAAHQELQERNLLPEKPLGTNFFIYIERLIPALRAGKGKTQDFIRDWRGRG